MKNSFDDLRWLNLPPEEAEKIINDYEKFKNKQVDNPVTKFVRDAIGEFQALLRTTNYDYAVKSTRKYIWKFQDLIKNDLVIRKDELIGDFILKITDSKNPEEYGVDFLMYTETLVEDAFVSLILVRINHTITANVTIDFGNNIIIKKKEAIPIGTYAVIMKRNLQTGKITKRVYYLPT